MALSLDLRERVVEAYQRKEGSIRALAERFNVGKNTVQDWIQRHRETGSLAPCSGPRGPQPLLSGEALKHLAALVEEKNDRTLAELKQLLEERHSIQVSESSICRALNARLHLPRKKNLPGYRGGNGKSRPRTRRLPQSPQRLRSSSLCLHR